MKIVATQTTSTANTSDTFVVGLFEDERIGNDVGDGALQGLVDNGEAKGNLKKVAVTHVEGKRYLVAGLGKRSGFGSEEARVAGATVIKKAHELGARQLCWIITEDFAPANVEGLVEGSLLAEYRFEQFKSKPDDSTVDIDQLVLHSSTDISEAATRAEILATAQNAARDLQNTPANVMTPKALAERAKELAASVKGLKVEVGGRKELAKQGMGAFAAVAQGSEEPPRVIALTYNGPGATGPVLGYVGKAVTFDTGGISIKPSPKMQEMKFDMSGGAAVLEAIGAIAKLRLPVRVVAVIGATENMPSGSAVKPGDIVTAMNGTTIEVNNTDAEGRLVLADCLSLAIKMGAERLVDMATLTGAILVALGSTYAGLMSNDDAWAAEIEESGRETGEIVWRLPLHEEYAKAMKGQYADLHNVNEDRKAGSITAAEFLKVFVDEKPWAHIDIAGTAWSNGKAYADKGGSGFGVRLLVDLARRVSSTS